MRVETSSFSSLISARRDSTSVEGGVMADTWGGAMSITLSATCAISSRLFPAMDDASTSRTLAGSRWRKSSRSSGPSAAIALPPSNCCIRRRS